MINIRSMIKIKCRTNLDLDMNESFPTELPALPRAGDLIESSHEWGEEKVKLQLEVCRIVWKHWRYNKGEYNAKDMWYAEVELGLVKTRHKDQVQFYDWYGRITGRGKHAFI